MKRQPSKFAGFTGTALSREQLKKVIGGDNATSLDAGCAQGCSLSIRCTNVNCPICFGGGGNPHVCIPKG